MVQNASPRMLLLMLGTVLSCCRDLEWLWMLPAPRAVRAQPCSEHSLFSSHDIPCTFLPQALGLAMQRPSAGTSG